MDLREYQSHPVGFQQNIYIPTGRGPRKFSDVMEGFQEERFAAVNPSLLAVSRNESPPVPRVWDERTKGGSKDTDWGINILWLMAFSRRPLRIQVGAYDQQQADELRLIVKGILKIDRPLNRFLNEVIDVQQTRIVNTRTESTTEILTTDRLGSHGSRPDVVLINELTHQSDRGFAETLLDNLDKMPCGFGIVATNAGFDPSWQLDWKRTFAKHRRWLMLEFTKTPHWIGKDGLQEAEQRNSPGRFRRLWRGEWTGNTEGALDGGDIDACVCQTDPMEGDEKGWMFVGGLDIGIQKHATAFVVVGRHVGYCEEIERPKSQLSSTARAMIDLNLMEEPEEDEGESIYHEGTGRLRLADLRAWKPKPGHRVSLEAVKTSILIAHRQFNLAGVALDPYQGEMLAEQLEKAGVPVIRTPQTQISLQDQATALVECFQQRTIELFEHDDLLADLKRLQIKDTGLKIRLVSPEQTASDSSGTGHGDIASALSFAISLAKSSKSLFSRTQIKDRILVY
jgi:hypothetical protein